jgi:hypothetical protein
MKKVLLTSLLGLGICSFVQAQGLVAGWGQYDPSSATFPLAANATATGVTSATMSSQGMIPFNDGRGVWGAANTSSSLNTATAPYLAWTINLGSSDVTDPEFFLNLAKVDSSTELQLSYSEDNYSSSLVDLSSVNTSYHNYVAPLSGTLTGSVTFRLYVYNQSAGYVNNEDLYNVWCQSYYPTTVGTYNEAIVGYTAGLLGDVAAVPAVPEPSTLALAGLASTALLLFRRRNSAAR